MLFMIIIKFYLYFPIFINILVIISTTFNNENKNNNYMKFIHIYVFDYLKKCGLKKIINVLTPC